MTNQDISAFMVLGAIVTGLITQYLRNKREAKAGARIDSGYLPYLLLIMESVSGAFNFSLGYNLGVAMFGGVGGVIAGFLFASINFTYRYLIRFFTGCIQHQQGYLLIGLSLVSIAGVFTLSQWAFSHHMNAVLHQNDSIIQANDSLGESKFTALQTKITWTQRAYGKALDDNDEAAIAKHEYFLGMLRAELKQAKAEALLNRPAEYGFEKNASGHYFFATLIGVVIELAIICLCLFEALFINPVIKAGQLTLLSKTVDWNHRKLYQGLLEGWFEYDKHSKLSSEPVLANAPYPADTADAHHKQHQPPNNSANDAVNNTANNAAVRNRPNDVHNRDGDDAPNANPSQPKPPPAHNHGVEGNNVNSAEGNQQATTIDPKTQRFEQASRVSVGDDFACAECGKLTKKNIYSQRFCSTPCRKSYHRWAKRLKDQAVDKAQPAATSHPTPTTNPKPVWTHFVFMADGSMKGMNAEQSRHYKASELTEQYIALYKHLYGVTKGKKVSKAESERLMGLVGKVG